MTMLKADPFNGVLLRKTYFFEINNKHFFQLGTIHKKKFCIFVFIKQSDKRIWPKI